jgi:hypothetical protein
MNAPPANVPSWVGLARAAANRVTAIAIEHAGKHSEASPGGHVTGACYALRQKPGYYNTARIAWAKLIAPVGREFPVSAREVAATTGRSRPPREPDRIGNIVTDYANRPSGLRSLQTTGPRKANDCAASHSSSPIKTTRKCHRKACRSSLDRHCSQVRRMAIRAAREAEPAAYYRYVRLQKQ